MQRYFLGILISVLYAATGFGQFQQGDKMVGTTVFSSFYNSGSSEQGTGGAVNTTSRVKSYGITVSPAIGWFISDQLVLGATVNINPAGDKTTYESAGGITFQSQTQNRFNVGIGGFARKYIGSSKTILPFIHGGFNLGASTASSEGFFYGGTGPGLYKETYTGKSPAGFFTNAVVNGGITKMLGPNAGLDLFIGYNYSYSKNTFTTVRLFDQGNNGSIDNRFESKTTTKFSNHGVILGIGFQVFLRKK